MFDRLSNVRFPVLLPSVVDHLCRVYPSSRGKGDVVCHGLIRQFLACKGRRTYSECLVKTTCFGKLFEYQRRMHEYTQRSWSQACFDPLNVSRCKSLERLELKNCKMKLPMDTIVCSPIYQRRPNGLRESNSMIEDKRATCESPCNLVGFHTCSADIKVQSMSGM